MKKWGRARKDDLLLSAIASYMLKGLAWRTLDDIYNHLATHTEVRGARGLPNALCTLNMLHTPSDRKNALAAILSDMVSAKALERRIISPAWLARRMEEDATPWDIDAEAAKLSEAMGGQAAICSIQRCFFDWQLAVLNGVHFPLEKLVESPHTYAWSVGVGVPGMPLRFHYGHTIRNAFERARACHADGYVPPGAAAPPRPNHL